MRKRVCIKQRDVSDCGVACLASIAAWYRLLVPLAPIRQLAGTNHRGTSIAGLIEAAAKIGLLAKGVKASVDSLSKIPRPAIAHLRLDNEGLHYVVLYKVSSKSIWVMDPAYGKILKMRRERFEHQWTGVLLLVVPDSSFRPGDRRTPLARRFFTLVQPHVGLLLQVGVGAIVYTALGLAGSIYLRQLVDHVLVYENTRLLNLLSVVMIALTCFQLVLGFVKNLFVLRMAQHIDARLILGYYRHLMQLPQRFFDTMRVGEILSRINDAIKIRLLINDLTIETIVSVFVVLFSILFLLFYHWKLALITGLVVPCYLIIYLASSQINKRWQRTVLERSAQLEAQLIESLNGAGTIKRLGLEAESIRRTEIRFVSLLRAAYKSGTRNLLIGSTSEAATKLITIIVLWSGSYLVIGRQMSVGELLSFFAILGYFTGPAMQLISLNKQVQEAFVAADRLFEIVDLETEQDSGIDINAEYGTNAIGLRFSDVHFRYGPGKSVLNGLELYIPKGKYVAIVGASGSGKSSVLALLHKLYPWQQGTISIGGYDIRMISTSSLRRLIGIVPQQIEFFAGTILENISVGDASPDLAKVDRICQSLGLSALIRNLPDQYYSYLEERGANLSGGQRQRLAIARTLYRDPEILVLDEATSSLDPESERYVHEVLLRYRQQGKTIIVVAHKLTAVQHCDLIFVLKDGTVAEQGTHAELMKVGGVYAEMWSNK